jgi:Domain of unknown function (DUF1707)/Cell wall-active antibiotics response 4TMS YvqF
MPDNNCMTPQGFNENSRLRASDADRDAAAAVINNALAEGRLTAEEHSDRLDAIYSARTHAEIVPLLDDLPAAGTEAAVGSTSGTQPARAGRGGRIVAIFGGASRKGGWHAEPVINVLAVFGGVELDFREAVLPGNEVVLKATAILGGVDVTVPPEMRVIDDGGVAILGGREITGSTAEVRPDAPVLRIQGTCVLGGIEVKRKTRRRRGDKGGNGITIRLPGGDLGLPGLLGQVREHRRDIHNEIRAQRHEILDQVRAQRHEILDQARAQRRDARRNWTRDSED